MNADARFRPSALPRLERCPASGVLPAVFGGSSDAAAHGTRVHELMERVVRTGEGPAWALELLEELDPASAVSSRSAEVALSLDGTVGTADYVSVHRALRSVTVADWKTGRTPVYPDSAQLGWYASAVAALHPVDTVRLVVVQMQVSEDLQEATWRIRERVLDALDVADERARVDKIHSRHVAAYVEYSAGRTPDVREGAHCEYCPAWDSCPAKTRAISTLAQVRSLPVIQVTRETAGEVYSAIEAFRAVLDDAEKAVKELARSGPVPLPDGRELWAVEETRESVADVDAAAAVLAERYGEDAVAEAVEVKRTVSKGALEAVAKKRAAPKQGVRDAKALVEDLRARGALKSSSYLKYTAKERKVGLLCKSSPSQDDSATTRS